MSLNDVTKRAAPDPWNIGFGAIVFVGALLALFVWFPADIPTGFFYINAIGREEPGDAFFPILLASLLAVLSCVHLAISLFRWRAGVEAPRSGRLTAENLRFLVIFLVITAVGLAVMYLLGPLAVFLLNEAGLLDGSYRQFTDTAPYKYVGYVTGGFMMTIALIAWTEGRVRPTSVATVLMTLATAIIIFDVLLKNILLPPNADF